MTDRDLPVTEAELHAYVDGELPADRRAAVEAWLSAHPDDMARVARWRALADSIHARYDGVAAEPLPARFNLAQIERANRSWKTIAAAAVIAAFLVGGLAGWLARGASAAAPDPVHTFTSEALAAHKIYVVEVRHPVEVPASEAAHIFEPAPQFLENVRLRRGEPLSDAKVTSHIKACEARLNGSGRLLVRKSGTEPVIRIMGEGEDEKLVRQMVREIAQVIREASA